MLCIVLQNKYTLHVSIYSFTVFLKMKTFLEYTLIFSMFSNLSLYILFKYILAEAFVPKDTLLWQYTFFMSAYCR